jgi:hypothetical protein
MAAAGELAVGDRFADPRGFEPRPAGSKDRCAAATPGVTARAEAEGLEPPRGLWAPSRFRDGVLDQPDHLRAAAEGTESNLQGRAPRRASNAVPSPVGLPFRGGDGGTRTRCLRAANATLFPLSYIPTVMVDLVRCAGLEPAISLTGRRALLAAPTGHDVRVVACRLLDRPDGGPRTRDLRLMRAVLCRLSYVGSDWWGWRDLNPRLPDHESGGLPGCPTPRCSERDSNPRDGLERPAA